MSERVTDERTDSSSRDMGTAEAATFALAAKTRIWRKLRQPLVADAAGQKRYESQEREARFQLANAALLWLWHQENEGDSVMTDAHIAAQLRKLLNAYPPGTMDWPLDVMANAAEALERRASSPAAGRDAVIDQAVKAARDASEAFLTDRATYVMMGPAGLVGSIVNAILRMKETPNGN